MRRPLPVRRPLAVALATVAEERAVAGYTVAGYSGMTGVIDALRGGTYVAAPGRVRCVEARVVTDAAAYGRLDSGRRSTVARLRLRGRGGA